MWLVKYYPNMFGQRKTKHLASICQSLIKYQSRIQTTKTDSTTPASDWKNARPFEEIPRPKAFEIIRASLPGGKYYKKDATDMFKLMNKEYGDVMYFPELFGSPSMLMCFNPNDFETVFRNEGIWPIRIGAEILGYHRKKYRADFFKGVEGLIATQGEPWGKFRSAVNAVLLQPKNVRLYLQKMSQVNQEFIERIKKLRDPTTLEVPADFKRVISRWTLESVAIVALDTHLGLLRGENIDPNMEKYFKSITDFFILSGELENKPSLWRILPTHKFKEAMKAMDNVVDTTSFHINETVQRLEAEKKSGIEKPENEKSVLEKLLKIDPQIAVVMAIDLLMAGVDTTTSTFTGIVLCLAKNPEKQQKLREEILRILPNKDSEFTEKSLNDMSYLRACIKESLRIYPLLTGNGRIVQKDVVLGGYRIPKGTNVGMMTTSVNFDEKHYPNPNEFLPERWLRTQQGDEPKKCPNARKSNNPFAYLPFGFGPRSCIGRRIVELELELGVARVIRNFYVSFNYPTDKAFKTGLINVPNIPLKFQFMDVE